MSYSEKPAAAIVGSSEERLGRFSLSLKIREDAGANCRAQWQLGESERGREGAIQSVLKKRHYQWRERLSGSQQLQASSHLITGEMKGPRKTRRGGGGGGTPHFYFTL